MLQPDYLSFGEPWWISTALSAADTDLVIPSPTRVHPAGIAGQGYVDASCIIITGIYYDITSGGFELFSRDPAFSPGGTTDRVIWSANSTGAVALPHLWIPLNRSNTEATPTDSAKLYFVGASAVGHITITGVHTTNEAGRYHASGTPNMPLTFPTP